MSEITINGMNLVLKHYDAIPVITFEEIDMVHQRKDGSARRNFTNNREHFIEGVDYFFISLEDYRDQYDHNYLKGGGNPNLRKTLLTETGYYLLAKTFNDKLSWDIQRALVLNYFNAKKEDSTIYDYLRQLVNVMESQAVRLESLTSRTAALEERSNERIVEVMQEQLELKLDDTQLMTNTQLAIEMRLYSTQRRPHQQLIKAMAYQAGLKVHLREDYEDEYIKIERRVENETIRLVSFAVYYKPKAVDLIKKWFEDHREYAYFENYYVKNLKYHKVGELKNRGFRLGKTNYFIA